MNRILQYIFLVLVLSINSAFAQTKAPTTGVEYLKSKVETGDYDAVREAGDSGDITLIPYLKHLASDVKQRSNANSTAFQAHIALAKLGDKKALQEILTEVDAENPEVQDRAMQKLSLIGGDSILKKFYQLLDDTSPRESLEAKKHTQKSKENDNESKDYKVIDVAVFYTRSSMAIYYLSQMIDNPPTRKDFAVGEKDIAIWKEWFRKNKPWID